MRRYRWERDRLPDSLADLRLGDLLLTDPYTGRPLLYARTGETTYTLSSAGPPQRDPATGNTVGSERTPITLPAAPPRPAP